MSDNMRASDTVIPALNKACSANFRYPNQELIFLSDRGIQYACNEFKKSVGISKKNDSEYEWKRKLL